MPKPRTIPLVHEPEQVQEPVPIVVTKKPRKPRVPKVTVNVDEQVLEDIPPIPVLKRERKMNMWLEHCKQVRQENEGVAYSQILKLAKESYKNVV